MLLVNLKDILNQITNNNDEIKIIATLEKTSTIWNNNIKLAIVTSGSVCISSIIDPYLETMKSTNWKIKTFKNRIEAEKWCI